MKEDIMKKGLIFLLTILFVVSMLCMGIGCKKEAAPAEEEVAEEEGTVTIVYMSKWNEG
jgi:preprotein translocase subunit SecG